MGDSCHDFYVMQKEVRRVSDPHCESSYQVVLEKGHYLRIVAPCDFQIVVSRVDLLYVNAHALLVVTSHKHTQMQLWLRMNDAQEGEEKE